jgi:SAM-dependent methyltransferase
MSDAPTRSAAPSSSAAPHDCEALFRAEQRHFWFRSRNRVLGRVVGGLTATLPDGYRVLEVGCGNGNVLAELERVCHRGVVVGVDLCEESLAYARRRTRCRLLCADVHDLPDKAPFDVIGLFDVLEHVPDDVALLTGLRRSLAGGGRLVLTVPANMALWSHSDEYAGHFRRYSASTLRTALVSSGYRVDYCTQFMAALYPLMWLKRKLAPLLRRRGGKPEAEWRRDLVLGDIKVVPLLNGILSFLLRLELPFLGRRWRLPLGTSLLAVAARS